MFTIWAVLGLTASAIASMSPWTTFTQILQTGIVEGIPLVPYVAMLLNSLTWLTYGFYAADVATVLVSCLQALCAARYVTIYVAYTADRRRVFKSLACGGLMLLCFEVVGVWSHHNSRLSRLGVLAGIGSMAMFTAPLAKIVDVVKSCDTTGIPLTLLLSNGVAAAMWAGHGLANSDVWLALPSLVGALVIGLAAGMVFLLRTFGPHSRPIKYATAVVV